MNTIELKVPVLPESTPDATVAKWHKKPGESFANGDPLVDLETDKVVLEVPAPESGKLEKIVAKEGETVKQDQVLATWIVGDADQAHEKKAVAEMPTTAPTASVSLLSELSPTLRRLVTKHEIDLTQVKGSGKNGRITKTDILAAIPPSSSIDSTSAQSQSLSSSVANNTVPLSQHEDKSSSNVEFDQTQAQRLEQRVPMTRLRATVAKRLMDVKQSTAMLTTFNEVNMQPIMDLRSRYRDQFEKTHHIRLGFMSFFVKATLAALERFPVINASIDGNDIVYHGYSDIGIAVSSPRGLVVPVLRNAEHLSMVAIEKGIADLATKAKEGKLSMEEITGGTFTITNGGVFGSMLSTPILNPPQSAILGMHNIVKRPIVENDAIVIRPMMYLALSYDHRLIDGSDSVRFLVTIKQILEDPARLLLDV